MYSSIFETVKNVLKETRNEFNKILQVQHIDIDLTGVIEDIKSLILKILFII